MTSHASPSSSVPASRPATSFHPAHRLRNFLAPTVWAEFTPLAQQSQAVNLGQGFPGWSPPPFVQQAAAAAIKEENGLDFMVNQYARSAGHMSLVTAIAKKAEKSLNRKVDPLTEVVVMDGASESLCAIMLSLLNPGDEVVVLEPAFDIYIAQVEMADAVLRPVPLRAVAQADGSKTWNVDMNELAAAFNDKTRLFLLNTPHNPTGKVFSVDELSQISSIVSRFPNVVVVADEVYEHMTYEQPHTSIASLPNMKDRTITVSSAGKTFSVTGWKIGWIVAPPHLARSVAICHQWLAFSVCTPLQQAIAEAITRAELPYEGHASYYAWLNDMYKSKRAKLCSALAAAGIEPIVPEGGFFVVGLTHNIELPAPYCDDKSVTRDWALCRWLTKEIGVAAIPPSSFYCEANKELAGNFARFAFCKPDEVLDEAAKRLLKVRQFLKK